MFRFEEPSYIYSTLLLLLAILIFLLQHKRVSKWADKNGGSTVLMRLFPDWQFGNQLSRYILVIMAIAMFCIALMNPQYGTKRETITATSTDVIIALDISQSMNAEDVSPTRLQRSQRFAEQLIRKLKGNNIGLVFFAGEAYLQMPMTLDYAAALMMLKSANTSLAGLQGTSISDAIALCQRTLETEEGNQRAVIFVTDGESHSQGDIEAIEQAYDNGVFTYVVGVGSEQGAQIPMGSQGFKKDNEGNIVTTKLNLDFIKEIAKAGGGEPYLVTQGSPAIDDLVENIGRLEKRKVQQRSFSDYNSYFQYFIFLGLFFLMVEYMMRIGWDVKRLLGIRKTALLLVILFGSGLAYAQDGKKQIKKGNRLFDQEKYEEAEAAYRDALTKKRNGTAEYNLGNTLYKQGKFEDAQQFYEDAGSNNLDDNERSNALFNLGNSYYQLQDFESAIESYKRALELNPYDNDAAANLARAKFQQKMNQQQQQQQQQQSQEQQDQQDQQSEEQQDSEQQSDDPENQQQDESDSDEEGEDSEEETQPPSDDGKNESEERQNQEEESAGEELKNKQGMSKEEAESLLEVIDDEEKKVQEKLKKGKGRQSKPKKDW